MNPRLAFWLLAPVGCLPACRGDGAPDSDGGVTVAPAGGSMILATTTSTRDSGLLDALLPDFRARTGIDVKVIAVGTGAALAMAAQGEADAVLTHAPEAECAYVTSGDLVDGVRLMHNDFVVVGPPDDPAGVRGAFDLVAAFQAIAARGLFVSRGDDSGTHKMELSLWRAAGIDPARMLETGQGMGATLDVASERGGYTLTDRATFLALRRRVRSVVVRAGDARLLNVYRAYLVSATKHPRVHTERARALLAWLTDPATLRRIGGFGVADFGEPLFTVDPAGPALPCASSAAATARP